MTDEEHEDKIGECFMEGRETSAKLFFVDVLYPDIDKFEAVDIV